MLLLFQCKVFSFIAWFAMWILNNFSVSFQYVIHYTQQSCILHSDQLKGVDSFSMTVGWTLGIVLVTFDNVTKRLH